MEFDTFEIKMAKNKEYASDPGVPTLDVYEYQIDKSGVKKLVKTDRKENVYDKIQADYDSTDINKLMLRFSLGETDVINQKDVFYGDVTNMPTTYAELFDRVEECKRVFDALPADLKSEFGNSYEVFFTEFNNDEKSISDKFAKYNARFENHQFDAPDTDPIKTEGLQEVDR